MQLNCKNNRYLKLGNEIMEIKKKIEWCENKKIESADVNFDINIGNKKSGGSSPENGVGKYENRIL